jgi:hypothetical protein
LEKNMNRALLILALAAVGVVARASILYDNGAPDLRNGYEITHWIQVDDVKLNSPGVFNTIRFWVLEYAVPLTSLDVSLYNNYGNGVPSYLMTLTDVDFTRTATGRNLGGSLPEYEIVARVGDQSAGSDIPFYVGLFANRATNPNAETQNIYWETTSSQTGQKEMSQEFGSTSWGTGFGDLAFRLEYNAVPEPTSIAVLGLGALALIRRRHAR